MLREYPDRTSVAGQIRVGSDLVVTWGDHVV